MTKRIKTVCFWTAMAGLLALIYLQACTNLMPTTAQLAPKIVPQHFAKGTLSWPEVAGASGYYVLTNAYLQVPRNAWHIMDKLPGYETQYSFQVADSPLFFAVSTNPATGFVPGVIIRLDVAATLTPPSPPGFK